MLENNDKVLYSAYFQSNSEYYLKQLDRFNRTGNCGFNVPAFFVGLFWMAYRKMYLHILVVFGLIYVEISIEDALYYNNMMSLSTYEVINFISMFVWASLFGFLSNRLYILKSKKDIAKLLAQYSSSEDIATCAAKKGGTNHFGPPLMLLILIVMAYLSS